MHLVQSLLLTVTMLLAITNAVPLSRVSVPLRRSILNKLQKRTNPIIGEGIDTNDANAGGKLIPRANKPTTGAFSNAQQLISYVLFTPLVGIDSPSPIFSHYFNEADRSTVKKVLAHLAGDPADAGSEDPEGAGQLGQITFQGVDTPNNGDDQGCDQPGTNMYMEYYDTDGPVVVVCEDAWVFPDRDDQNCDALGDTLTPDFAILGHLVLHEFTHWDWFLKEITGGEIVDKHGDDGSISGYGLDNAYHDMDKKFAPLNADSYAWYATEVLWSVICSKSYNPPSDDDSEGA